MGFVRYYSTRDTTSYVISASSADWIQFTGILGVIHKSERAYTGFDFLHMLV